MLKTPEGAFDLGPYRIQFYREPDDALTTCWVLWPPRSSTLGGAERIAEARIADAKQYGARAYAIISGKERVVRKRRFDA